ncbi:MAG: SDR family NAD(P)-dependent oxidoreductase, partial [Clostridiales bacterium]|nr:SDR family NAD(P)-dependent oxidoreductase [Clostridiales bacterium]
VNVISFMKFLYHYLGIFAKQDRGAIINISSITAVTSSPYNAQYGAGKAYILKMTEAVAYECAKTNVDVLALTAGSTVTPTWLKNMPGGPDGEKARKAAMLPEDVIAEAVEELGKTRSVVAGERNKASVKHFSTNMTADEQAAMMGSYYE